jgi:ABC-2 type transport system permease protein
VWTVARREFLATITRKGFLFTLLLMPAWIGFAFSMATLPERLSGTKAREAPETVGVVDSAGVLGMAPGEEDTTAREESGRRYVVRCFPSLESARAAFDAHRITGFLVLPASYLQGGPVAEYRRAGGILSRVTGVPWRSWTRGRLLRSRVEPELVARVQNPVEGPTYVPDDRGGFKTFRPEDQLSSFFVPMGFGMLLFSSIFAAAGYLLQGLGEEKESRILESLLSSVTAEELMAGKLFGLGGAGLLLGLAWGALGLQVLAVMAPVFLPSPWMLAVLFAYFVLGYLLFGTIALGLGSLVNSYQEAQTVSAILSFTAILPWMVTFSLIEDPSNPIPRVLSWIPISAPTTMSMRLAQGGVPAWEVAASLALLALAAWLVFVAAARIFRVALLLYGKTWNLPEILRWIGSDRQAGPAPATAGASGAGREPGSRPGSRPH